MITIFSQRFMKYSLRVLLDFQKRTGVHTDATHFYFGYGANLSLDRFRINNMVAERIGSAVLSDHKINFSMPCEYVGQGYASVQADPGSEVWGSLFRVNREALLLLDVLEWVPFGFYERKTFSVVSNGIHYQNVWVYVAKFPQENLVPSTNYLRYILKAATQNAFPQSYLEKLESFKSQDQFALDPGFRLSNPSKRRLFEHQLAGLYRRHDAIREKVSRMIP